MDNISPVFMPKTSIMLNNTNDLNLNRNLSAFSDYNPVGIGNDSNFFTYSQKQLAKL